MDVTQDPKYYNRDEKDHCLKRLTHLKINNIFINFINQQIHRIFYFIFLINLDILTNIRFFPIYYNSRQEHTNTK